MGKVIKNLIKIDKKEADKIAKPFGTCRCGIPSHKHQEKSCPNKLDTKKRYVCDGEGNRFSACKECELQFKIDSAQSKILHKPF